MTVNSVDIHLNAFANFSPVFAEVAKLKASMAEMQSSSFGSTLSSDYVKGLQGAQQQFTKLVDSTRAFNIQNVQMADSTAQFSKQLEAGQLKLGQYFNIAKQAAKGVSTELDNLATQQARIARSVVIPDALHSGYAQVITDLNGTVAATEKATLYQTAYNTVLRDGANKLIDFGKNMQWAGRQLTVGLTVPLALFASQAAKSYLAFDQQMTDMLKVYGSQAVVQSQQALDTIRTQVTSLATDLAHTIGVTMTDTVTIAQTFSQMGLTGQDLLKTTQATAGLMKLGGLTAAGSAQAAIAMQNVFKLQSNQMTDAINFLNAAKHSTSTSMQDIVDALPKVGPIITQLGGSYKDFATMLVALRENGVPASQAANTIKSMFATLVNPTTKAISEFNNLGISLKGIVSQDANNPLKMLTDLQTALDKLPSQQRTKAIEELFGKFQFARADALISSLGAAGSQNAKVMQLYGDTSAQLAAVAAQEIQVSSSGTPAAQYNKMKASLQADLIPVGQSFLQVMTKIGNAIDKIVQGFNHLGSFKTVIFGGLAFAALIGPIVMFGGLFANLIGNILKGANYARMFKEGFAQATNVNPIERFGAGLKNLSNFYKEVDVSTLAASHSSDLMTLSAENSTKAFSILGLAIESLAKAIAGLNAVAFNPVGNISAIQDTVTSAGAAAETAFATLNLERPMMLATGGYVPGAGNSDSQPAFLTPGEAVIPKDKARKYAPFIQAMLNGTVGMFNGGELGAARAQTKGSWAHIELADPKGTEYTASQLLARVDQAGVTISDRFRAMLQALADKEVQMLNELTAKFGAVKAQEMMPKFNAYGSLGVHMGRGFGSGKDLNTQLDSGTALKSEVVADWKKSGISKWDDALKNAGTSYEKLSKQQQDDLRKLDQAMLQQIEAIEATTMSDKDIAQAYLSVQKEIPDLSMAQSSLIKEFNALAFQITEFRSYVSEEALLAGGFSKGVYKKDPSKQTNEYWVGTGGQAEVGGNDQGRKMRGSQNWKSSVSAGSNPFYMTPEEIQAGASKTELMFDEILSQVESHMSDKVSQTYRSGFVSGIENAQPAINAAVEQSQIQAIDAGRMAIGAASPAKIVASMLGLPFGQGAALGIEESAPQVIAASEALATQMTLPLHNMEQPMLPAMSLIDWKGLTVPETKMGNTNPADINAWQSAGDQQMLPGMAGFSEREMTQEQKDSQKALADIANNTEETGKVAKESKGMGMMGKMGGMMALSMIAPMAINALPGGPNNALKTTASNVTQFAGMGMMLGPEGAAAGAAIGGLISVMDIMKQRAKDVAAAWKADTTTSVSDLQIFKSTAMNTSISTKNLSIEHVNLSKKTNTLKGNIVDLGNGMTSTSTQIQAMVNAIKNLPKGDPLGDLVKAISDPKYKVSGVVGNLKQSVENAISTGGLDPSQAKSYVYSALQAAGRTSDFGTAWKEISKFIGWNDKAGKADTSKTTTSSLNALSKSPDFQTQVRYGGGGRVGGGGVYSLDYSSLTGPAKAYADQLKNLYAITSNGALNFKDMQARLNAVRSATGDSSTALDLLEKTIIATGSKDDIARLNQVEGYIKAMGPHAKLSASEIMKMNAVLQVMTPDQLKAWAEANGKKLGLSAASKMGAIIDAYAKSGDFKKAVDAANKSIMSGLGGGGGGCGGGGGGGPTTIDYTKMYAPTIKHYTDLKKLIDDQATAQKKYNDQLKATQDYQSKQMDYFNQAKNALTSGNYLGAAQAQQDALSNQADFAGTMQANKTNDQSAAIGNIISALNDAASNSVSLAKAAKYEGMSFQTSKFSTKFDNSLLGGQSKAQLNASTHSMNAQALAAASAAQQLTHGDPFSGVTINQNVSIDGSVITPNELIAQLHAHAAATAAALAEKIKQKTAASHKVGKSGASSSRVPTAPKMPKVGK